MTRYNPSFAGIDILATLFTFILLLTFQTTFAQNNIHKHLPNAQEIGSGKLNYLFWDVYSATLYTNNGQWSFNQPFALTLDYHREISGSDITKSSIELMSDLGFNNEEKLALWETKMLGIFPDVNENSRITGVYTQDKRTIFYDYNQEIGVINDPEFGYWFFSIWLSENSPKPKLRRKLLGEDR
jgi:hypothetical protein